MIELERHASILTYLEHHDILSLTDATHIFKASPSTIRRDFNILAEQQLVQRIRGGIKCKRNQGMEKLPFALREIRYSREKDAIAQKAAALLHPGEVLIVDGGTTTFHLGTCLPTFALRVITTSIPLAAALAKRRIELRELEIFVTGGFLDVTSGILLGPDTRSSLAQYHAQWVFLATDGITEKGITNMNYLSVETKQDMIANADKVVVLADHSKIGKRALTHVCGLDKVDILITDARPESEPVLGLIRQAGVEVIVADTAALDGRATVQAETPAQ